VLYIKKIIKNVNILDSKTDCVNSDILIDGDTIAAVGCFNDIEDAVTIDLSGLTILPAFIDSHVHVMAESVPDGANLEAWIKNGVSRVKDLGILGNMPLDCHMEWLRSHSSPKYTAVSTAGRYIDVAGGYGMGPMPDMKWGFEISSPGEAAAAVEIEYRAGVNGIKVGINEARTGAERNCMTREELKAVSVKADELGIWTTCHVTKSADLAIAVEAGIREAAHTPGDIMDDSLIHAMVNSGISMTTTVGDKRELDQPPDIMPPWYSSAAEFCEIRRQQFEVMMENLGRFSRAGGRIQIGTDYMRSSGFAETAVIPVWEMENLLSAGIPLNEVIMAGTLNGALSCGIADEGLISAGMKANLIAIDGRPGETFRELLAPVFIMNRGEIIKQKA